MSLNSLQLSSMQIDLLQSTHPIPLTSNSQLPTIDSFNKFQQELNEEILYSQPNQTVQKTSTYTPLPTNDIRTHSLEQDNQITQDLA